MIKNFFKKKTGGTTLIETVVSSAISVMLGVAIVQLLISQSAISAKQTASTETTRNAYKVFSEIEKTIKSANKFADSHMFGATLLQTSSTTLIAELRAIDTSQNIIAGEYDYAAIYVSDKTAYIKLDASQNSVRKSETLKLANSIFYLSFKYNNDNPNFAKSATTSISAQSELPIFSGVVLTGSTRLKN